MLIPLMLIAVALAQDPPGPELVPPELIEFVELAYPPGVDHGEVRVELVLLIAEDGSVESAQLLSGPPGFAEDALRAAERFMFTPAFEGDEAIAVEVPFTYIFPAPPVNLRVRVVLEGAQGVGPQQVLVGDTTMTTDDEGVIALRNLAPGERIISLQSEQFESEPVTVSIAQGELVEVEILGRMPVPQDEIIGIYRRRRPASIERTITAEEVRTTPGTMGDPIRAVQNLPGLVRTPLDAGWLLVRGGDPEDTGLFIDGVRVPLIYHLGGFSSVIHPEVIREVAFMPGGYDARYGRATAGAVELKTRPVGESVRSSVGVDLVSSSAYVETPALNGGGFAASVRRSYLDLVLQQVPSISEEQSQIAPRFWDGSLRVDKGDFGGFLFGYADSINAPTGVGDETVTVTLGTLRFHGRWDFDLWGRDFRLSPMVAREWRTIDVVGLDDMQLHTVGGGRLESQDDGSGTVGTSAGLDAVGGWFGTRVNRQDAEGKYLSVDPYAALRVGRSTSATMGLRGETLWIAGQDLRLAPSPRVDVRHPLGESTEAVADFGLYHQHPMKDVAMAFPGGPYLPLEESWGGGMGIRTLVQQQELELDGYVRKLSRIVLLEDDGSLGVGEGLAYGVEALVRYDLHPFTGWISYGYTRSLRAEEQGDLLQPHIYDQPHTLVAVSALDLGKEWTLAARFRVASGYMLQDTDQAFDILTQEMTYLTANDAGRLPPFHALDVKLSRLFTFKRWDLDGYLDIQNLYNRRVPEPAITGVDDQQAVYTYGLMVLPIFGVQGRFGAGR